MDDLKLTCRNEEEVRNEIRIARKKELAMT
jgi:hypothetical protein